MGYIKNILANKRYLYYYFQKSLRSALLRKFFWKIIAFTKPSFSPAQVEQNDSLVTEFKTIGFSYLPNLSVAEIGEIEAYLATKKVYNGRRAEPFEFPAELEHEDINAHYFATDLIECQPLLKLANHPMILGALEKILGCKPTISTIDAWWSVAGRDYSEVQNYLFHRDVEDLKFAKLFLYLTDVDSDTGPHVYIKGSQNSKSLIRRGSICEQEVSGCFKTEDCFNHVGTKGTVFLEDTWGVHRGIPPKTNHRLMFSVTYTLTGQNPYRPAKPYEGLKLGSNLTLDQYVNRAYLRL